MMLFLLFSVTFHWFIDPYSNFNLPVKFGKGFSTSGTISGIPKTNLLITFTFAYFLAWRSGSRQDLHL